MNSKDPEPLKGSGPKFTQTLGLRWEMNLISFQCDGSKVKVTETFAGGLAEA